MLHNLHFFPSKCRLFHNATLFGFCITHILNTGCAKIWKKKSVAKRLKQDGNCFTLCAVSFHRDSGDVIFLITFMWSDWGRSRIGCHEMFLKVRQHLSPSMTLGCPFQLLPRTHCKMHARPCCAPSPVTCEGLELGTVHGGCQWRVKLQPESVISFVAYSWPRIIYLHIWFRGTDVGLWSLNLV